jgi:hypothetical protein
MGDRLNGGALWLRYHRCGETAGSSSYCDATTECGLLDKTAVMFTMRPKSFEPRNRPNRALACLRSMFVVVAGRRCLNGPTRRTDDTAPAQDGLCAWCACDQAVFYTIEHHYPIAARHGALAAQTRAASLLRPDMGPHRRRLPRSERFTCRQDSAGMGTQAGGQKDGRGQRQDDLAKVQPTVACHRHYRGGARTGA